MKSILKNIFLLTLPSMLVLFILLEIFFRLVIAASQNPDLFYDQAEKMVRYDENGPRQGQVTLGRFARIKSRWRINNFGWNSILDYLPKKEPGIKRIAVIGDSYIAAMVVDVDKNFMTLLDQELGTGWQVYSFGKSGYPASQYLHVNRYVDRIFDPDLLVFHFCHNDFDESLAANEVHTECLQLELFDDRINEIPPTGLKLGGFQWVKSSALFRYLYYNLHIYSMHQLLLFRRHRVYNANVDVEKLGQQRQQVKQIMQYIILTIKLENPGKRVILMMDGPREDIYNNNLAESSVRWVNVMFDSVCTAQQMEYLDLTDIFAQDFQINHKRFNSDLDGHWDEYGHQVVARALYDEIIS
ncbi:SGNH/GDSL hydrolase family protein, partial [candidate division KSB1 bacterium]|nr:SGNH/GDSL hydrolase family protein [candidate division KSB1 bacterium]